MTNTATNSDKVRENRLRRAAQRQGLALSKSKRRDPRATDYGMYVLIDPFTNSIVFGAGTGRYDMTLDQIEAFLTEDAVMNEIFLMVGATLTLILLGLMIKRPLQRLPEVERPEPKAQTPLTWQQLVTILVVIGVLGVVGIGVKEVMDARRETEEFNERQVDCLVATNLDLRRCMGMP